MTKSVEDTVKFIQHAHGGQTDKTGEAYWKHPVAVSNLLPSNAPEWAIVGALLHDVLEDTSYSMEDLLQLGFDERSLEIVDLLTRKNETYREMIERIATSGNYWAIQTKLADNAHNTQPDRADLPEGMVRRYRRARERLEQALA